MNKISHFLDCFLAQVPGHRPAVVTFNAGIHDLAQGQECAPFFPNSRSVLAPVDFD